MSETVIDQALLESEWVNGTCPSCKAPEASGHHDPGCCHDAALAARGYPGQTERAFARARIYAGRTVLQGLSDPTE